MAYEELNIGTTANDGTGDSFWDTMVKIKNNFVHLMSSFVPWSIDADSPVNGVTRIRHGFNNFLGNSNFEIWLAGTSNAPSAWTIQGDASITRSSTATAGAYSAQITFGTANTGELFQAIPTNTVVDYTLSCYVQRLSGSGRARLVAQQGDSPYTEFASVELSTDAGFQLAALTVKPSAGTSMRFAIKSYDAVASVWLIDECMFEESKGVASTWSAASLNDTSNQNVWGIQYFKQAPEFQYGFNSSLGGVLKAGLTPEGGFFTCYVADETLVAGDVVHFTIGTGSADGVTKCPASGAGQSRSSGVVYEGASSGSVVKVVESGRVAVYCDSAPTKGWIAIASSSNAGRAVANNSPDAANTHWLELGHFTGASVTKEGRTLYYITSHRN